MASSVLPWKWVIESLAEVPDVSTSILSELVVRFPDVLADSSGVIRERLSLRYLEECSGMACGETPPTVATDDPTSASAAKIDAAQTCEEVLLSKVATANIDDKGKAVLDGDDLQRFIHQKRMALPKSSIYMLKEKILGSYHPDFSYPNECNGLTKMLRPAHVNHLTSNGHRDHDDGFKKFIRTMKYASPWMNKLTIIRKYRKLKNVANNMPLMIPSDALQRNSKVQEHFLKQNVFDVERRNQQTNDDGACNVQYFTAKKPNTNNWEEFHDAKKQLWKDNLSSYFPAPNGDPDNFDESVRSGEQSQKQNVVHDDRANLQEVADGDCDVVQLLEQSSIPQSSSAQNLCIKCGKGGQLLNCCGDDCSRSIHESCLGLLVSVDENGIFYCPLCAYRNARRMYTKSKRKAQEAERNLFSFYEIDSAVHALKKKNSSAKIMTESDQVSTNYNNSEHQDLPSDQQFTQNIETSNRKFFRANCQGITENQQNQLHGEDDDIVCKIILPCKESVECHSHEDAHDPPMKLVSGSDREEGSTKVTNDQQPVNDHGINENGSLPCDVNTTHKRNGDAFCVTNSRNEVCKDQLQVHDFKNSSTSDGDQELVSLKAIKRSPLKAVGDCDHNAKRNALASQINDRFAKRNGREKDAKFVNYQGVAENQQTDISFTRLLRKNTYQQNRCFTPKLSPSRRTKLIWKPEEEEMLEEAMQKVPKNEDGSIPWIKILEYGHILFHESRTPIDVKDKWRNMQKKEDQERISLSSEACKRPHLKVVGECDHNAKRKAFALQIRDKFARRNKMDTSFKIDNNQQTDISSSRELRKNTYRQNQCFIPNSSPSRRTKLIWKSEEEEILAEAMQNVPKNEDGSMPWMQILEYGRRFFHESRTAIDLKDKWRNLQKKRR